MLERCRRRSTWGSNAVGSGDFAGIGFERVELWQEWKEQKRNWRYELSGNVAWGWWSFFLGSSLVIPTTSRSKTVEIGCSVQQRARPLASNYEQDIPAPCLNSKSPRRKKICKTVHFHALITERRTHSAPIRDNRRHSNSQSPVSRAFQYRSIKPRWKNNDKSNRFEPQAPYCRPVYDIRVSNFGIAVLRIRSLFEDAKRRGGLFWLSWWFRKSRSSQLFLQHHSSCTIQNQAADTLGDKEGQTHARQTYNICGLTVHARQREDTGNGLKALQVQSADSEKAAKHARLRDISVDLTPEDQRSNDDSRDVRAKIKADARERVADRNLKH